MIKWILFRLVQIVERRNEIVECLEIDRRREVEEDKSINKYMGLFAGKAKNNEKQCFVAKYNVYKSGFFLQL